MEAAIKKRKATALGESTLNNDELAVEVEASTTVISELADGTKISYRSPSPPPGLYKTGWCGKVNVACSGFSSITTEHVRRYAELGFLVVEDAFGPQDVEDALEAIDLYCAEADTPFALAAAANTATTADAHNGHAGPSIQFESSAAALPRGTRAAQVRKLQNFHDFDERLRRLAAEGSDLRRAVSALMGLGCDALEVFQSTALLKPPGGREKPWHQDHAYFNVPIERSPSGAPTDVVGCWLALDPCDEGNACMFLQPGVDKLVPVVHWQRRDWQMCDDQIAPDGTLAVPLRPGSLLLFSSLLPHGTPPNTSTRRRRALQWHFVPQDKPRAPDAMRHSIFGNSGKAVEC